MNTLIAKIAATVGAAALIAVMGWFAGHALTADQYITKEDVKKEYISREVHKLEIQSMQGQLNRIEKTLEDQDRKLDIITSSLIELASD